MAAPEAPPKPEKRRRQDREFRIMFRPTDCVSSLVDFHPAIPGPPQRRKLSRILGLTLPPSPLVDDLCAMLLEKSAHWALVVLKAPYDPQTPRIPVIADDSRIERVFEANRKEVTGKKNVGKGVVKEWIKDKVSSTRGQKGKGKENGTASGIEGESGRTGGSIKEPHDKRAPTLDDSSEDDRHEDDEGFPEENKNGKEMEMQMSEKPRHDFEELQFKHLRGPLWEILTGIEARTKFTNTELKHEAARIWKRQQNYHVLDNNCQRFCILLAMTIRAKNHSLLRVLHGETVKEQIQDMKFEKRMK